TVMILPIFDSTSGTGNNGTFHISRLGAFLLLGYNLNGQGSFKLAYLGDGGECATLVAPPARTNNVGITGLVQLRPRHYLTPKGRPPVQYEVILDTSLSMSWNFAGQAGKSNNSTQCTGQAFDSNGPCQKGWSPDTDRRIAIAKDKINKFIDHMLPND